MFDNSSEPNTAQVLAQKNRAIAGWSALSGTWWAILAFLGPQLFIAPLLVPVISDSSLSENIKLFLLQVMVQCLIILVIVVVVRSYKLDLKSIGLGNFSPKALSWAIGALCLYLVASTLVAAQLSHLVPKEILEKEQAIAFASPTGLELLLVFLALVVVTPIVEEIVFRGFLFRAYRRRFGVIFGAILVSVLFGLAHGQLNVGIDTFILSLFLCLVYVKTESLWAPIFLHALKNFVAFYFLFIIGTK